MMSCSAIVCIIRCAGGTGQTIAARVYEGFWPYFENSDGNLPDSVRRQGHKERESSHRGGAGFGQARWMPSLCDGPSGYFAIGCTPGKNKAA